MIVIVKSKIKKMEQSKHGQGVTSVVVHQRPGGNSSIQLGGGYGGEDDRFGAKKAAGVVPA